MVSGLKHTVYQISFPFFNLAINEAFITLKANQLSPGERYSLSVNITSNEKDPTLAVWDIMVNFPPYNGSCTSSPKSGKNKWIKMVIQVMQIHLLTRKESFISTRQ